MNPVRYFFPRRFWIVVACALVFSGCDQSVKNDPVGAMDHFFALLGKQKYREAYKSGSIPFQAQLSEMNFEAIARDLSMSDFTSVNWTLASTSGKEAHLNGEFLSKSNQKLALAATVIQEEGLWKLYSMRTPSPKDQYTMVDIFGRFNKGIGFNDAFTRTVPDDGQCAALVKDTMLKFNECLHKKTFDTFFADTSALWQSQTTPELVARAFKPFVDAGITIDFIKDTKPIFDEPPRLDAEGHLLIKGYYPTVPNKVVFTVKYVFELPKWKLLGITVNFKQ